MRNNPHLPEGYDFPILPDNSMSWTCYPLDHLQGNFYVAPDAGPEVTEAIFQRVVRPLGASPETKISGGSHAHVHRVGDIALKVFRDTTWQSVAGEYTNEVDMRAGLSAVIASVAMHEGLQRIRQPRFATKTNPKFKAPKMLGAFVGYEPWIDIPDRQSPIVWAMSFEEGREAEKTDTSLPGIHRQAEVYDKAIEACGIEPGLVFHDIKSDNILVRNGGRTIVKLDTTGNPATSTKLWQD